ncbi:hypothetical protein COF44_12145 [Bacillus toyonensis]|uniref:hypothetical protein n=1 Tax=Bacillus toyonensis TaxID=155322 RepID=UPI000BFD3CA4|nr:hypothetical protein [Bacillus toyonensis]PHD00647.1 hypothetical protein COF44_12145 [Bacillus toyonensis]
MERSVLYDALIGIFSYDMGCVDSGIKNELLRSRTIMYLQSLEDNEFRVIMSTFVCEYFVSDAAIKKGYGIEDVSSFIHWLDKFMGIDI